MSGSSPILAGSMHPPGITELDASEALSPSILLETRVYFADRKNSTTATAHTCKGHDIQASICFADPPALSYVCIHCPGADFADEPRVVRSEKQFLLLHLQLWPTGRKEVVDECYMYQLIRGKPRLSRIPELGSSLGNYIMVDDFGIYPCDDGEYILAGLSYTAGGYEFYTYSSALRAWTVRTAHMEMERLLAEDNIPVAPHKVIPLGGSLLGWVDLWKGILICDVLCQDRYVEVGYTPLPFTGSTYSHHLCPWVLRDVTCTNGSLQLIEIEHLSVPATDAMCDEPYFESPLDTLERGPCWFVDWRATVWNSIMFSDDCWRLMWNDNCWRKAHEVHGDDIFLVEELGDGTVGVSTARNMLPYFPTLSIHGDHVVHMSTYMRLEVDRTQMISVDMRSNTLKALAPCPPVKAQNDCPYFPCELSSYLRP